MTEDALLHFILRIINFLQIVYTVQFSNNVFSNCVLLMYNRKSSQSVAAAVPSAAAAAATESSTCGFSNVNNSPPDFDASQPSTNIQVRLADGSR